MEDFFNVFRRPQTCSYSKPRGRVEVSESKPVRRSESLGLDYLYGGLVKYRAGESLALRTLSDYELILIIEGSVCYSKDGKSYNVPSGGVVLSRPGFKESCDWDLDGVTRHAYVHFQITSIPDDWPDQELWPIVINQPAKVVAGLFRYLLERVSNRSEWPSTAPGSNTCRLLECLLHILIEPNQEGGLAEAHIPDPVSQALNMMRETLDERPTELLSLERLAQRSCTTEKHLCRLFKQSLGYSPMKTFSLLKLQLAMALLSRSDLSIKQLALRCGFENPLYFSRVFSQTYHASPSVMRRRMREGEPPPLSPLPPELTPRVYW